MPKKETQEDRTSLQDFEQTILDEINGKEEVTEPSPETDAGK